MVTLTRAIRGWELSRQLTQDLTLIPLRKALVTHAPGIHHSDQGIQYASNAYTNLLEMHNIQISMPSLGNPKENGYAERLIRTIKEEEVDLSEYRNFSEAYQQMGMFVGVVYTHKRIHSALGYLTPAEFESAWWFSKTQLVESPH